MSLFDGQPLDPGIELQFPELIGNRNLMVRKFGLGPDGVRCKSCRFLVSRRPGQNSYWKCEKRGITGGPATDHRVRYDACALYQERA